jgi:hypothetical protein
MDQFIKDEGELGHEFTSLDELENRSWRRNLNKTTPMDGYPMLVADGLVYVAAGHKVISFIDN